MTSRFASGKEKDTDLVRTTPSSRVLLDILHARFVVRELYNTIRMAGLAQFIRAYRPRRRWNAPAPRGEGWNCHASICSTDEQDGVWTNLLSPKFPTRPLNPSLMSNLLRTHRCPSGRRHRGRRRKETRRFSTAWVSGRRGLTLAARRVMGEHSRKTSEYRRGGSPSFYPSSARGTSWSMWSDLSSYTPL